MKLPTKAIICAAGLGTRFLPQTKAMPKEMLPIIDKPVIQLIVEEAVAAGVTDIIMVTGATKRPIEDHFDRSDELEAELRERGKDKVADRIKSIAEMANFVYIRQKGSPKGNARPVLNAQHLINDDEPFFVFFPDDFFRSEVPRAVQLLEAYKKTGASVISLNKVDRSDADKYGMVATSDDMGNGLFKLTELVEKPGEANAPSDLATVSGFLLAPEIWPILHKEIIDKSGEITLSVQLNELLASHDVYGQIIDGVWHDAGDPLKYIKAVIDIALEHETIGDELMSYLRNRIK
ncbi:MAG: sugar phosphate nucleotidyltransferase [Candidatus Saccharimonadales bacterium]